MILWNKNQDQECILIHLYTSYTGPLVNDFFQMFFVIIFETNNKYDSFLFYFCVISDHLNEPVDQLCHQYFTMFCSCHWLVNNTSVGVFFRLYAQLMAPAPRFNELVQITTPPLFNEKAFGFCVRVWQLEDWHSINGLNFNGSWSSTVWHNLVHKH